MGDKQEDGSGERGDNDLTGIRDKRELVAKYTNGKSAMREQK